MLISALLLSLGACAAKPATKPAATPSWSMLLDTSTTSYLQQTLKLEGPNAPLQQRKSRRSSRLREHLHQGGKERRYMSMVAPL